MNFHLEFNQPLSLHITLPTHHLVLQLGTQPPDKIIIAPVRGVPENLGMLFGLENVDIIFFGLFDII